MRWMKRVSVGGFTLLLAVGPIGALCGCEGSKDADLSPEAKKADDSGQKAMEDYMKAKGQTRPKAKS